jgi:N-acetylneuraminic acid mutarotase
MPQRRSRTPITSTAPTRPSRRHTTTVAHPNLVLAGLPALTFLDWPWPNLGSMTWNAVGSLNTGRGCLGAALLGQKVYTFGGSMPPGDVEQWLDIIETFDVQTHQSKLLPLHLPQAMTRLVVARGPAASIYVTGGAGYNTCYELNSAGALTQKTNMPKRQYCSAGAVGPDGKIYVMGGLDPGNYPYPSLVDSWKWTILKTVQCFNPANGTWSEVQPLHTPRHSAAAAAAAGKIYVFGGLDDHGVHIKSVEEYDPATNQWTLLNQEGVWMPRQRYNLAAVTGSNGRIYVIGGMFWCNALDAVDEFDPATKLWRLMTPMPTPRYSMAAAATADGRIFVLGGWKKVGNSYSSVGVIEEGVPIV